MIALLWLMTAAVWGGHIGLLFVSKTGLYDLLVGHAPTWVVVALLAALLPQLYLIPWAWHHVGCAPVSVAERRLWRASFFFTGFLATTAYLVMYRSVASDAGNTDRN